MVSLSTKVTSEFKDKISKEAESSGKSVSDFLRICLEEIINGRYIIVGERLMPTESYLNELHPVCKNRNEDDMEHLGYMKILRNLRRLGYPDEAIKRMNEQWNEQVYDMPKYNPRKVRDWDAC